MRIRFLEIAEAELDEAISYYDAQAPGLGKAFLLETISASERIQRFPEAWQAVHGTIRRCRLARFPYALLYTIDREEILVLAVAHLHRRPSYWRDRLRRGR